MAALGGVAWRGGGKRQNNMKIKEQMAGLCSSVVSDWFIFGRQDQRERLRFPELSGYKQMIAQIFPVH